MIATTMRKAEGGAKRLATALLALVMALAMSVPAFAADLTINDTNDGETYSVYKIFDATSSDAGTTYYISTSSEYYNDVQESSIFTLVATGDSTVYQVTWASTVSDDQLKAELVGFGAQGNAVKTATGNGGTVTIEGLDAGYYFVTTTTGTAVSIGNTGDAVTIADKNKEPVPAKTEITDGTAGIGSVVEYSVTISDAGDVTKLTYHDTMTKGLTFNNDVDIEGMTVDTDYTVSTNCTDGCTFEVVFTAAGLAKITGSVTIAYSATVNENAVEVNGNTGKVTYGEGGQTSIETKTKTKVYDFDLTKVDSSDNPLTASFTLAKSNNDLISFVKVEGGYRVATQAEIDAYEASQVEGYEGDEVEEVTTTISAGSVNVFGLDAGTYTLTETAAPAGYNMLDSAITVTIAEDGTVSITGNSNGSIVETTGAIQVVNNAGSALPGTGGMGTTIFYIVGGVLVIGAVLLLVTRRRMARSEQ